MTKVVSSVPESRFEKFGVTWPEAWDVKYIERPFTDEGLKEMQDADYILVDSMDEVLKIALEEA